MTMHVGDSRKSGEVKKRVGTLFNLEISHSMNGREGSTTFTSLNLKKGDILTLHSIGS